MTTSAPTAPLRPTDNRPTRHSLRLVIALVASVQFYVALEGSMLLPLGPLLAARLGFPVEHVGYLNGSFLVSAAVAGIVGSLCLDRFDRRIALSLALAGLAIGTAAAALATSLPSVMACRLAAGLCGGPAVSLGLAVIGDVAPPAWRGRAMAAVSVGSSIAIILGVPMALQITEWVGWRGTFFIVGGVGLVLAASAATFLPSGLGRRSVGGVKDALRTFVAMLRRRENQLALANGALSISSINLLAMNLAGYFLYNLGTAEHELKFLWAAGGAAGLVAGQASGRLADRFGTARVLWGVCGLSAALYFVMFVLGGAGLPVMLLMCLFLVCATGRIVLGNTLASLTAPPEHRARFMSMVSASNQASAALAMGIGAQVLSTAPSGALLHMDALAIFAIVAALLSPVIASRLLARLNAADPNDPSIRSNPSRKHPP